MYIVIIDGQGGRVGSMLIEALRRRRIEKPHRILAVGSNATATTAMLKAGADIGATGENPILVAAREADIICGPIGIVLADAMLGEVTPAMAAAVGRSAALKVLLPMEQCGVFMAGSKPTPLSGLIEAAADRVLSRIGEESAAI